MRLRVDVDTLATVRADGIAAALTAREDAHAKHGENSIEAREQHDFTLLAILVEEVGEIANALTYDGPYDNLESELAQVMAVAWAWHDQLQTRQRCRVCGCTDQRACPGGCWWVEPDLCSTCHPGQPDDHTDGLVDDSVPEPPC